MEMLSFQPIDTPKFKLWSTSTKYMHHNQWQERCDKLEKPRTSILYFESTWGTFIDLTGDWKHKCSTNSSHVVPCQPPCKTKMDLTPPDSVQIPCESGQMAHLSCI